jgi:hypothetical protein
MLIKTKFKIEQEVFVVANGKLKEGQIRAVHTKNTIGGHDEVKYLLVVEGLPSGRFYRENEIYKSRRAFIK